MASDACFLLFTKSLETQHSIVICYPTKVTKCLLDALTLFISYWNCMFVLDKWGIVFILISNRLYYLRDRLERDLIRVREYHGVGHSLGPFTHTKLVVKVVKVIPKVFVSLCHCSFGVDSAIILNFRTILIVVGLYSRVRLIGHKSI